ncbi:MAG TPA: TetR/AcrR family transcriptional regulator [Ensifer sp.]|nr:TetR/AcrR family transcriptional regulator [Ensifer sp.]
MGQADEKIEVILEAARVLFFSRGYDTTSMDLIAREAAVSKATVYAHFKSKEQLLLTLIEGEVSRLPLARHHTPPQTLDDLKQVLTDMAQQFDRLFQEERTLALNRLVISQALSYPEIAQAFYRAGPVQATREVSEVLERAAEAGLLTLCNPSRAAIQFLTLVSCDLPLRALLSLPRLADDEVKAYIQDGVSAFIATYGCKPP